MQRGLFFLITAGMVFTSFIALAFAPPLVAAEKAVPQEAIWNSANLQNTQAQTQAEKKLAKQRALWRAKWEAEQRAKQQQNIKRQAQRTNQAPPKPLTREQYHQRWQQAQRQKQQRAKAAIPTFTNKDLEKYATTKKRPHNAQAVKTTQAKTKPSHAPYRKNTQAAIIRTLPHEVTNTLSAAKLKTQGMSAYVTAVNAPRPLLGYQDQTSRVPASVMKLITSYAALGTLGPKYRWPIDVFTRGQIRNGTLQGDLYIKGYGAPEFNQAELRKVLKGIRQKGIRNINGRVVFDNSYFQVSKQPSFDGKSQSAYNAQPDALLYNERISSFQVKAVGKKVRVNTSTPTYKLKIVNRMKKTRRGCRPKISVSDKGAQTIVTFSGRFSSRCGMREYHRVISQPAPMIYGAMQALWKRDVGGNLRTQFAIGRVPKNARPLLRTYSRTLAEILPIIDKDSNNVMARQVMLTIGAKMKGRGTQEAGANAINDWLISRGLHFPELRIENGSGLSRRARISARHVGDLLVDAYRSPYRNILIQSLAVAGVDGTMKRRLKASAVRGKGFFKTGTLRDVRSIAGYVKAADGNVYVMAILHNDPRARSRALAAHDQLIEWVYSGGRERLAMR